MTRGCGRFGEKIMRSSKVCSAISAQTKVGFTFADRALWALSVLSTQSATLRRSAAVGSTNTRPAVAHLLIMHARVVDDGCELEHLRRQPADVVQDGIRRDHAIMLRGDERDTSVDQRLLS